MRHFKNLVRPYLVWSFLIIVIPLFLIFMYAVTTNGNSLINIQFTLNNFKKFIEPVYITVFMKSINSCVFMVFPSALVRLL